MQRLGRDDPARPASLDKEIVAEFAELGVTFEEDAASQADESEADAVEVWDINWKSVSAFIACQTQWRVVAGFSRIVWLGLDYSAVDVVLRRQKARNRVFEDLRVMEMEALRTFDEVDA